MTYMNYKELVLRIFWGFLYLLGIVFSLQSMLIFSLSVTIVLLYVAHKELPRLYSVRTSMYWLLLLFYLVPTLASLVLLAWLDCSYVVLAFIIAMTYDSAAYLIGSFFGKHMMAPAISPRKTWEGFFGGILAVIFLYAMISHYSSWLPKFSTFEMALLACLAALGDLFESWLKRRAGVKDTGNLLPGHGGLLDRIDSLLFVNSFLFLIKIGDFIS